MAIKTQLGTQRYNNRMDKIWESAQKAIKETEAKIFIKISSKKGCKKFSTAQGEAMRKVKKVLNGRNADYYGRLKTENDLAFYTFLFKIT